MKKLLLSLTVFCCLLTIVAPAQNNPQQSSTKAKASNIKKSITKPNGLENSTLTAAGAGAGSGGKNIVLPDSDGDGVTDQFDQEQTPPGCPVDSHGVSRDTDGDGVPDCRDKELVTPTVCQPVDADGVGKCPCPEDCGPGRVTDADGDGVIDELDQEQTPPGCPVDTHGVSRDTDGDGVPDCRDKELITPTVCQPVDADGVGKCPCPEDCGPVAVTNSVDRSGTLHDELHKQEALNKVQAEEIKFLRNKLEELISQVNSFSAAVSRENKGMGLRVYSMPNPSHQYFTIRMQSGSSQPISIKVLDATGKLIEERGGITANGAIQIGEQYRAGSYLVEVLQGNEKTTLRLIKQVN